MSGDTNFDVIIIGGSYSGLAAAMALGRALRRILVIDSGAPCNRQTPYSHNFITQDGKTPREIATLAKLQVQKYSTVTFINGLATSGLKTPDGFKIQTAAGESFSAKKIIFAAGIKDVMPGIEGFAACWGITVLHCPYCHGYEVKNETTGIMGNGALGFEFCKLISNWTKNLTLFTNGKSVLTPEQTEQLQNNRVKIVETGIERLKHTDGQLEKIIFTDGTATSIKVLYTRLPFEQHCTIPQTLACELTDEGYIKADAFQKTSIHGVFVCGDSMSGTRTLASAVATGTVAGMAANKEIINETFF